MQFNYPHSRPATSKATEKAAPLLLQLALYAAAANAPRPIEDQLSGPSQPILRGIVAARLNKRTNWDGAIRLRLHTAAAPPLSTTT